MSDYIITVNSTVDTTKEWLAERGVPYIPLMDRHIRIGKVCLQKNSLTN